MTENGSSKRIKFALQTNGVLLDDTFCSFLKQEGWLVGLSIDGRETENDSYRKNYDGKGSYEAVSAAMERLKRHQVEFNTLTVITKANVQKAKELFNFFLQEGSGYMQFIPCYEVIDGKPAPFCCSPEEFGAFMCELFDLWYNNGHIKSYVRFFEELLMSYVTLAPGGCNQAPKCIAAPVVEHTGDVYPCDFFVESNWYLGNIADQSLQSMLDSSRYAAFYNSKRDVGTECADCKWLCLCNGDCKKNRSTGEKSYFCEGYKLFFAHSHKAFLKMKQDILSQNNKEGQYYRQLNHMISRNDKCPCGSGNKYKKCCMPIKAI